MADNHQPQVVDLTINNGDTESWIGKDVSSVITVDDISKVILLKTKTSAPTDINIRSILSSIEKATKFESHSLYFPELSIIYEALLLTKKGKYIRYISTGELIRISLEDGDRVFKWHKEIF
ncbi:hypothetical protein [Psychromonas algicola]|uniref:hypothetical protein n=1 Tax=Psychromonas algicola TaxID=2555642 RepID=UPI0010674ACB|nr:hypothetical protein [Psychromonas sp. RZ5]TEW51680.1 hypothetical protein E2R67_06810 [Psychromonas sp. RZ5]